ADRFLNRLPLASLLTSRTGQLLGLPEHAQRLLEDERLLLVFPEGGQGTATLFSERRSLRPFPSGFLRLAMRPHTPIVPVGILGAGEAIPTIANWVRLGQAFGLPYLPITPYLLPLPLPARFEFHFGEPMHFDGSGDEDGSVIEGYLQQVQDRIRALLENNAAGYRVL